MQSNTTDTADLATACGELVTLAARFTRAVSRSASYDVPAATLRLLSQLDELGPVGVSRLARADRCAQPTMSAAVNAVVAKEWAAKQPHPSDARAVLVHLTDEGAAVLADARRQHAHVVSERLLEGGTHGLAEVAAAVDLLRRLLQHEPPPTEGTA